MHQEKIASVYQSTDYARFKKLLGNREISEARVNTIMHSIESNGWIMNPIVVNEKYEIIDGQGRYTALRKLGEPIQYVIHNGATIEDCVALNLKQKNWTVEDYARSYASQGYEDYIRLVKFSEVTNISILLAAHLLTEKITDSSMVSTRLKNSAFTVTDARCSRLRNNVEFIHLAIEKISACKGHRLRLAIPCLLFCYLCDESNSKRVYRIVEEQMDLIPPLNSSMVFLDSFSRIYNKGLTKDKQIYFDALYKMRGLKGEW